MVLAVTATAVVVVAIAVASVFVLTGRDHPSAPAAQASATQQPPPEPPEPLPPSGSGSESTTAPPNPVPPLTPPPGCANCTMLDGVTYRIGGTGTHTARAGQYHSAGPTGAGGCTIKIVRMGNPSTEKSYTEAVDALVKDTEQFTSHGCKPWVWEPTP
jgi:hypothetical protein